MIVLKWFAFVVAMLALYLNIVQEEAGCTMVAVCCVIYLGSQLVVHYWPRR